MGHSSLVFRSDLSWTSWGVAIGLFPWFSSLAFWHALNKKQYQIGIVLGGMYCKSTNFHLFRGGCQTAKNSTLEKLLQKITYVSP
jgi:hypothetical protein